jgi:hypothetical protein
MPPQINLGSLHVIAYLCFVLLPERLRPACILDLYYCGNTDRLEVPRSAGGNVDMQTERTPDNRGSAASQLNSMQ